MDEAEVIRIIYRMAGEVYDQNATTPKMSKRPLKAINSESQPNDVQTPVDPKTDPSDTDTGAEQ
jgi:hypothetical protein